jgi:predicted ArsR family transcriptional regulator
MEGTTPMTRWDRRFFASTRGQIVTLLRRGDRTVDDLAQELRLTDNAVRSHLAALERDGLVAQGGLRRGGGKPAFVYDLTPEAKRLFPKADGPLLRHLLDVLAQRLPAAAFDDILAEVGQRAAASFPVADADRDLRARVHRAVALLDELGGLAACEEGEDAFVIRGFGCPLAAAAPGHPAVCRLAAALLTDVIGVPVCERCEPGEPPRCRFDVPVPQDDMMTAP